jgi:hypothetical protein
MAAIFQPPGWLQLGDCVDEQLKPGSWSQSGLEYSTTALLSIELDPALYALREAGTDLGLHVQEETDGRLVFREAIHGFSWPIRVEVSVVPKPVGSTAIWVLGTCPRFSFPGLDFAYMKALVDRFMRQAEIVAREKVTDGQAAVSDVTQERKRMRARQQRLTVAQRVPLAFLAPAILASFFAPRELVAAVWLVWVWLAGTLILPVEIMRRRAIGVEPKQYVGITIVWAVAALAFTLYYLL